MFDDAPDARSPPIAGDRPGVVGRRSGRPFAPVMTTDERRGRPNDRADRPSHGDGTVGHGADQCSVRLQWRPGVTAGRRVGTSPDEMGSSGWSGMVVWRCAMGDTISWMAQIKAL